MQKIFHVAEINLRQYLPWFMIAIKRFSKILLKSMLITFVEKERIRMSQ